MPPARRGYPGGWCWWAIRFTGHLQKPAVPRDEPTVKFDQKKRAAGRQPFLALDHLQVLLLESPPDIPANADKPGAKEQHGNGLGYGIDGFNYKHKVIEVPVSICVG